MLKYLTKSRVGLIFALPSWGLLFLAFLNAMGDPPPDAPVEVYEKKALYTTLFFFSALILFLASLILATWGLKKDKWISVLTYVVHVAIITVLLFFF